MHRALNSSKCLALLALFFAATLTSLSANSELRAELKVGDKAPGFSLPGLDGKEVKLASYAGKKTLVVAFLRAHW